MSSLEKYMDYNVSQVTAQQARASGFAETARAMEYIVAQKRRELGEASDREEAREEFMQFYARAGQ